MNIRSIQDELLTHASKQYQRRSLSEIKKIVIHHSGTHTGTPSSYANYHVTHHGWPGIGYHHVIQKDGTVYKCNNLTTVSYHVSGHNRQSVGICLTGDFRVEKPTKLQYNHTLQLTKKLLKTLSLSTKRVFGHRECRGHHTNICPGIAMAQFRKQLSSSSFHNVLKRGDRGEKVKKLQIQLKNIGFDPGPIDGIFGPFTEKAVRRFQQSQQLSVDEIVGEKTKRALDRK